MVKMGLCAVVTIILKKPFTMKKTAANLAKGHTVTAPTRRAALDIDTAIKTVAAHLTAAAVAGAAIVGMQFMLLTMSYWVEQATMFMSMMINLPMSCSVLLTLMFTQEFQNAPFACGKEPLLP